MVMVAPFKLYFCFCNFAPCRQLWSVIFMSCYFMPCKLVRHFHVLQFYALHIGRLISCLAISCPAILMVRHFHVQHFQSTLFSPIIIRFTNAVRLIFNFIQVCTCTSLAADTVIGRIHGAIVAATVASCRL